eukprot:CAMPEP_0185035096 /NCGR_PEP_ID=MMETSP1103-20130426/25842_1 /TAXON_ID=36769 /ORGANISM="Paraphysomonas bandaiensis, Strain Caron Lab Isolate" /LENGTH=780 /DNA_ID=CAMNT_0027572021 /DNA_START=363 /DNA_END=2705 /DNA_ORIENTATION=-
MEGSRLLKAVIEFVSRSRALQSLEIDSVYISPQLITQLGSAITHHQSGIRNLSFKNIPMGDEGLRLLTPHISKCHIQCLSLEKCELTDSSVPFITSIIKSQEAMQDKLFWNSTLRVYPDEVQALAPAFSRATQFAEEDVDSPTCGLATINLSRNVLTSRGASMLCNVMRQNQWIQGLNLSYNKIDQRGVHQLLFELMRPGEQQCALLALPLRGNPGCETRAMEMLREVAIANEKSSALESMHPDAVAIIIRWLSAQKDTSLPSSMRKLEYKEMNGHVHTSGLKDVPGGDKSTNDRLPVSSTTQDMLSINSSDTPGDLLQPAAEESAVLNGQEEWFDGENTLPTTDAVVDMYLSEGNTDRRHPPGASTDYLQDFGFEGVSPTHSMSGIDNRPPSRVGIRPRNSSHSSHMESTQQSNHGRPPSRMSERVRSSYDIPTRGVRYTGPYDEPKIDRRSRSADRPRTRASHVRSRSADGWHSSRDKKLITRSMDRGSRRGYMQPTENFKSYRRSVSEIFEPSKSRWFHSDVDHVALQLQEERYRKPQGMQNKRTVKARTQPRVSRSPPPRKRFTPRQPVIRRTSNHRSEERRAVSRKGASSRRNHTDSRQNRTRSVRRGQSEARSYTRSPEKIIEEIGYGMMTELSKVVDTVSADLRAVSSQLRTLSTSMSESMVVLNSSRDMSRDISQSHSSHFHSGRGEHLPSEQAFRSSYEDYGKIQARDSAERTKASSRYGDISGLSAETGGCIQIEPESDEILTEMIQEGIRKKLLGMIQQSEDSYREKSD